jgi:hypothetical protein
VVDLGEIMTIVEALRISKETGRAFTRKGSQFVQWDPRWKYKFTGDELLADDWEDVATAVPNLSKGLYRMSSDYPPVVEVVGGSDGG